MNRLMVFSQLNIFLLLALLFTLMPTSATHAQSPTGRRCFEQTGLCIKGRIREFWEQNGGLDVFGLPITPQQRETIEGQSVIVQWFERNRLELHPDNAPPYDVMLGRLGTDLLDRRPPSTTPVRADAVGEECAAFPETGISVCGEFLQAYRSRGVEFDGQPGTSYEEQVALFGLPLTPRQEEVLSDGTTYTVQWFERARFELHPEAPSRRVQFGLLSRELRGPETRSWPRYELTSCPFAPPPNVNVECGHLTVPEVRNDPNSRHIKLAVATFFSAAAPTPTPDPVVYLSGGPGSGALVYATAFANGWSGFLANRDFIILDQRGTGYSQPALNCPESAQLALAILGMDISQGEKVARELATALGCRERLVGEGVDPAGYTSAATATDLDELRQALGYEQWNLFGISYGTRVALTAMRDYPAGIRSAILDSTYPPQVNLFTEMPGNMNRSFTRLFGNCAINPTCNANYPNLETVFYDTVDQLNRDPVVVWPTHPYTGQPIRVHVDGVELMSLLFRLSYDSTAIPRLPEMIYTTYNGNTALLQEMEQRRLSRMGLTNFSHGTYFSVECSEEISFSTPEALTSALNAYPHLRPFFEGIPENTQAIFDFCDAWGVHEPDPIENQPVVSDIPTLILAGEYDPITPPTWGQRAAETLSTSYFYEFPETGHAVITRGECPQRIIRSFLDNPMTAPDASCIAGF